MVTSNSRMVLAAGLVLSLAACSPKPSDPASEALAAASEAEAAALEAANSAGESTPPTSAQELAYGAEATSKRELGMSAESAPRAVHERSEERPYAVFYEEQSKIYFANGHFFYYTCEDADAVLGAPSLEHYPWIKSLVPVSLGALFAMRQRQTPEMCARFREEASALKAKYGTADAFMRRVYPDVPR